MNPQLLRCFIDGAIGDADLNAPAAVALALVGVALSWGTDPD